MHFKKFHKESIPEQIENANTIQFLESPIRTNLDYTVHINATKIFLFYQLQH